jgi:hypothetical protein
LGTGIAFVIGSDFGVIQVDRFTAVYVKLLSPSPESQESGLNTVLGDMH